MLSKFSACGRINGDEIMWGYTVYRISKCGRWPQGRILVEIMGEVEKNLGEVQRYSLRPPWKVRAQNGPKSTT